MAGDWIKMRTNLDTDPAVVRIASGLKTDRFAIVGRLHKIWSWANEHLTDGQDVPVDADFLDSLVSTPGFSAELRRVGWLSGRDGCLVFPGFQRHNGSTAKARALDAARKKGVRDSSEKCPVSIRTETGLEKRREEKSNNYNSLDDVRSQSAHWRESEDFRKCWLSWLSHVAQAKAPVTTAGEQQQLYELARFPVDEAIAIVRYSTGRAVNLILNGDHKKQPEPYGQRAPARRKVPTLDEGII